MKMIRTLIVDDNIDFRNRIRKFLEQHEKIEVIGEASDGHEAVDMGRTLAPDLILMDIRMPGMNGLQAVRKIKTIGKVKVIVLSAFDQQEYKTAAKEMGASTYVIKKNMVDTLIPAIRKSFDGS